MSPTFVTLLLITHLTPLEFHYSTYTFSTRFTTNSHNGFLHECSCYFGPFRYPYESSCSPIWLWHHDTLLVRLLYSSHMFSNLFRDCCKPSCAWSMSGITSPVKTCDVSNNPLTDANAQSGCAGGTAYMCSDQSPWAINDDLAYGFAAVSASSPNCCSCYQLTFTSTVLSGKKMIVQATNTGDDVGSTQFDLAVSPAHLLPGT